ncbi:hypothetical protein GCM10028801_30670 [Nocardioides maradonensis]
MGGIDRLRRITDLFVEGTELHLGDDAQGPIVIWVNKLNPFQVQEAMKDASARRFMAIADLKQSGEYDGMVAETQMLSRVEVASRYVELMANEIYLEALDDIDIDAELRKQREALERAEELMNDAGMTEDSPDRDVLAATQSTWMAALQEAQESRTQAKLREAETMDEAELREKFLERWRDLATRAVFEREHQVTQIFYATRLCKATGGPGAWDHTMCDHSKRYLGERSEVVGLPTAVLNMIVQTLDGLQVSARAAGNSDAPASSSESLEPSSAPEEVSNPSSPAETPSAAPSI